MAGAVSRLGNIFGDVAIKAAVRLASTAGNIVLNGLQSIDGVAGNDGDRVLAAAQADPATNGIWQMTTGPWIRTADAAKNTDFIDGSLVLVSRGNVNAGKLFALQCTDNPIVIGSSALVFISQTDVLNAEQTATSTTTAVVGIGFGNLAISGGKAIAVGQYVLLYQTSNPVNAMLAQITATPSGHLWLQTVAASGSGTHTDWTIVLANSPAAAGRIPPIGTGNVTGPGSSTSGHLATFADTTGKNLADSGIAPGTLAGRSTLLYGDAAASTIGDAALIPGAGARPFFTGQPNDNLHLVNDATNPTRDINVTPGRCPDDADLIYLQLAGTMVKRLDTAWTAGGVPGAPAGGCDSGSKGAGQTWHVFAIARRGLAITSVSRTSNVATISSAGHGLGVGGSVRNYGIGSGFDGLAVITAVTSSSYSYANAGADVGATGVAAFADGFDVLASQSYPSPALPSGWTVKQGLGSFLTDGSGNLLAMTQIGDEFLLAATVPVNPVFSVTAVLFAVSVPLGVKVMALMRGYDTWNSGTAGYVLYSSPDESDQAPIAGTAQFIGFGNASYSGQASGEFACRTDTSARLRVRAGGSFSTAYTGCRGWRDPRRRLF